MGYSAAAAACCVHDALIKELQDPNEKSSNCWNHKGVQYFDERGRENSEGAITGTVQKTYLVEGKTYCKPAGSYRIEPDGRIARYPTSSRVQREKAMAAGLAEYRRRHVA
jgi:hypothetical protein